MSTVASYYALLVARTDKLFAISCTTDVMITWIRPRLRISPWQLTPTAANRTHVYGICGSELPLGQPVHRNELGCLCLNCVQRTEDLVNWYIFCLRGLPGRPNLFIPFYVHSLDNMVINTFLAVPFVNFTALIYFVSSILDWVLPRNWL